MTIPAWRRGSIKLSSREGEGKYLKYISHINSEQSYLTTFKKLHLSEEQGNFSFTQYYIYSIV